MLSLLRLIIWIAGVATILFFGLQYFGYETDPGAYMEQREICLEKISDCRQVLVREGTEGIKEHCQFDCVDPKLFIRKR